MIGPSVSGAGLWRLPPVNTAAPPVQVSVPVPAQIGQSVGLMPTWQSLSPIKQAFTSPAGYPLVRYTLPNGHRIFIEQRPTDVVGIRTFVNTGSIMENPVHASRLYGYTGLPSGIAHLDEHCHFLATEHFPVINSLSNTMDAMGIRVNATTSPEIIQHESFFNREDALGALKLHAESVLRPIYNPADVNQEKTNVLNEAAQRTRQPEYKIQNKLFELLFDRPLVQTVGTREDVLRTTPQHFQQFRNLAYAPTNLVTVVSGNVDPDQVFNTLAPDFGSNPPRYSPTAGLGHRVALQPGEVRSGVVVDPQFSTSTVLIGFPAPPKTDLKERIAMEFLSEILDSDPMSLLQDQVVNRQQLATGLNSGYDPFRQSGLFSIKMDTLPGHEQRALAGTINEIARLSQGLVPDQKINEIRERLIRRFQERQGSVHAVTYQVGEEAADGTLPYYLNYVQLARLVRAEDLLAVAQKYLDPRRYAVVYGLPGAANMGGVSS
jgi:zinc protease